MIRRSFSIRLTRPLVLAVVFLAQTILLSAQPAPQSLQSSQPRKPHKLRVTDKQTAAQILSRGGELVADYGAFQLFEVDAAVADEMKQRGAQDEDRANFIELSTGALDTRSARVQSQRQLAGAFSGKRLRLVQFAGPIQPEWRAELEASGVRIVSYIPQNTYLVYGDSGSVTRMQSRARSARHVQWDGDFLDDYKIHPRARPERKQDDETPLVDTFAIQMVDDPDANAATLQLIDALKLAPLQRQFTNLDFLNVIVSLPPDRVADIAARPEVVSIQPYFQRRKFDERQDQIIAGNLSGSGPSGPGYLSWLTSKGFTQEQFTDSGFVVDVTDSGVDNGSTSPGHFALYQFGNSALGSRVVYNRLEGFPNSGSTISGCDGHGTLNSHIIAGYNDSSFGFPHTDSSGFRYGLGVCPFVKVGSSVIFDPDNFTSPNYNNLQSRAYHDGARISANSWGASVSGAYDVDAQNYDRLVRDAQPGGSVFATSGNQQMVIVFAAGNDGPGTQTVGSPGTAKNVITVGAAENVRSHSTANGGSSGAGTDGCGFSDFNANNANDIASFSSRGPCSDGRKKPDIVAPGTHVTGGVAQNSPPPSIFGTGSALSCFMASGVCGMPGGGSAGNTNNFFPLGQQFYTTSSGTSHSTPAVAGACALLRQYFINNALNAPSPAMSKAFLMNSARYLNGSGANDTLWSTSQGMGGLNLGMAFDDAPRILRDQLSADKFTASGQTRIVTGAVADTGKPFRVTLAWTDAPGSTSGNAFNNNLDLTVTVGGNTYKGNVFSGDHSVTGGSADFQNNVESVFIPAGISGNFTVTVTAANINSDGVPNEAPSLDQDFALVIYNGTEFFAPTISVSGTAVIAENCAEVNHAIDPGETVTLNVGLRNVGTADATNLIVTLLATNGITPLSGARNYGTLIAGGSSTTQAFSFVASGSCGGGVTAVFQLMDGSQNLGTLSYPLVLGAAVQEQFDFSDATFIAIPATGSSGRANPYPSTISVSGVTGAVSKVTVSLRGLSHTWPDDMDILLVGPTGQTLLLMSDCGGGGDINEITLTFDDGAAALSDSGQLDSGTFKPTNFGGSDSFNSPAPVGTHGTALSVFNGLNPNGTWSLYVMDDASSDAGRMSQGWSLSITTSNLACCSMPEADLALSQSVSTELVNLGSNVTFTVTVTNLGPDAAPDVVVSNQLPAGLQLVSALTSQGALETNGNSLIASLGTLNAGAEAIITIEMFAQVAGDWTNAATVESGAVDITSANNAATRTVAINSAPTISSIANQQTDENVSTAPIPFTIGDAETPATLLELAAFASDTNIVPDANLVFGGADSNRTLTITPALNATGTVTVTVVVSDGSASAETSFLLTIVPQDGNHAPMLAPIGDVSIFENTPFVFTNVASDVETSTQTLTFTLLTPLPGATLGASDGVFEWTPDESQGPSSNFVSIAVADDGVPSLSATQSFWLTVLETNDAPQLLPVPQQVVVEGDTLIFTNLATDADVPANGLTFSMDTNGWSGVDFDPVTGVFKWTPPEEIGPSTNILTVFVTDDGVPPLSATQLVTIVVLETNFAPQFVATPDEIVFEGQELSVFLNATDTDVPVNVLTFALDTNAPAGAEINATNGLFTWTPTEEQGSSTNLITVIVTDDGSPWLSATQSFTVIVLETNSAPVLAAIEDRTIYVGTTLTITNSASDSDSPSNTLAFTLDTNAPPMASIDATNGVFIWTPELADADAAHSITVRVTDDGSPPLSDEKTFLVNVLAGPVIQSIEVSNEVVTVVWSAIENAVYRLQFSANIVETNWNDVSPDVPATGSTATNTDAFSGDALRYYRVMVVP